MGAAAATEPESVPGAMGKTLQITCRHILSSCADTGIEARSATKASCYTCYKLFWSNLSFAIPAPATPRTGGLSALEEQSFCSDTCWFKAETKTKIADAKKARTQRIASAHGSRPSSAAQAKPPAAAVPESLLDDDDDI